MNYTVAEKLAAAERGELWWDAEGSGWTKLSDDVLGPYVEADVTATWATYHIGEKPPKSRTHLEAGLLDALRQIDAMCMAPPNFSDATIQEIARAAIAKAEAA